MNAAQATPHAELIAELMNPNIPKNEREHAAVREIERLREALAQPAALETKNEPVAWMSEDEHTVYTSKQVDGCFQHDHIPLYTTPERTWVGLTDEEIETIYAECNVWDKFEYERMLEAKLKEKNT